MQKMAQELGIENRNDIIFDVTNYKYDDMFKFYNQGNVFVSPTRAEAFNIPCLEAMACGLPVITTNFGGQTDYCDETTGWIIGGELEEVKHEIQYEGIKWLTPSIMELRNSMRDAFESEVLKMYSDAALEKSKQLTWNETAFKIISTLEQ
jgi:glycosyltransferase involved in cell wall biosynthesis